MDSVHTRWDLTRTGTSDITHTSPLDPEEGGQRLRNPQESLSFLLSDPRLTVRTEPRQPLFLGQRGRGEFEGTSFGRTSRTLSSPPTPPLGPGPWVRGSDPYRTLWRQGSIRNF